MLRKALGNATPEAELYEQQTTKALKLHYVWTMEHQNTLVGFVRDRGVVRDVELAAVGGPVMSRFAHTHTHTHTVLRWLCRKKLGVQPASVYLACVRVIGG